MVIPTAVATLVVSSSSSSSSSTFAFVGDTTIIIKIKIYS